MVYYKLELAYLGTHFKGWQSQKDSGPTIQDTLNKSLREIFKSDEIITLGSGRTDSGVNSLSQIVKLTAPFDIEPMGLLKGLNSILPSEIRVTRLDYTQEDFHPTVDAKLRTYRYYFSNQEVFHPLQIGLIHHCRYPLSIEKMQKACSLFIGEHDFLDFSCKGSEPKTKIRKITECKIIDLKDETMSGLLPHSYYLEVSGTGFLKQMVRAIMGSLLEVGRDSLELDAISKSLKNPTGSNIAIIAPAQGLVKFSVDY